MESLGETNVFARLGKGTKRKEDLAVSSSAPEKPAAEEDVPEEADSPRQPSKRPLVRSRGPAAGLFGRALSDLRRDKPARREGAKDAPQQGSTWEESEREEAQAPREEVAATPPTAPVVTKDVQEAASESGESNHVCNIVRL